MVKIQLTHQKAASELMQEKHQVILEALSSRLEEIEKEVESADEESLKLLEKEFKKYSTLYNELMKYCNQLVIIGYNYQNYDVPLIRRYLPKVVYLDWILHLHLSSRIVVHIWWSQQSH